MSDSPACLTINGARALQLAAQGLLTHRRRRARKADVLAAIENMRLLQIDTIHVIARSPYLVLYSRLGPYTPAWLDELLADGRLFETWAHEACFAPMADWRLLRSHLLGKTNHWAIKNAVRLLDERSDGMNGMLDHVRKHGPVRSADFEREAGTTGGGWWGWKDEKRWLEAWFGLGELMVARRENFQRVYDLTGRVLANAGIDAALHEKHVDDAAQTRRILIERGIRALGITRASWVADYFRLRPKVTDDELAPLVADGSIRRIVVNGWSQPAYVHRDWLPLLVTASQGRLRPTLTTLLSPFDPLVWDRQRVRELFDFDYRLECYVPAGKRRYGYFVLPILHRGRLVGRLDAKAHRRERVFEIRMLEFDEGVDPGDALIDAVAGAIVSCARWHGADVVTCAEIRPRVLGKRLQRASTALIG